MKSLVVVLLLTLIADSQCGLVDGLLGKIKQTTQSVTNGVGEVLHYGKNFVFGGQSYEAGRVVTKPGIFGTISLKIHDVAQAVRNAVRNIFVLFDGTKYENETMGRFFDKMKYRAFNIHIYLRDDRGSNTQNKHQTPIKLDNDTAVLGEKLRKFVFKNKVNGEYGLRQTLFSIRDAINNIRNNITKHNKDSDPGTKNKEEDGAGLIDVRQSASNIVGGIENDFENGVDAAYDKVEEGIDEGREKSKDLENKVTQNAHDFIDNQRENVRDQLSVINNSANMFKQNSNDVIENQTDNLRNSFNEISDNANKFKNNVDEAYDKVNEGLVEGAQQTNYLMNTVKQDSNAFIESQRKNANDQLSVIDNIGNQFKQNSADFTRNQRENVRNNFNEISSSGQNIFNSIRDAAIHFI